MFVKWDVAAEAENLSLSPSFVTDRNRLELDGRSAAAVTFVFTGTILFFQFVNNVGPTGSYTFLHWLWNYDLGFVKRGLVGTVFDILRNQTGNIRRDVVLASELMLFATYLAYCVFSALIVWKRPGLPVVLVALSGAVLQPALPALSFDFGRLDQINIILCLMMCIATIFAGRRTAGCIFSIGSAMAILVHEAFLIIHLPLCLALLAVRLRGRDQLPPVRLALFLLCILVVPAVAFVAVWSAGAPVPKNVWIEYWTQKSWLNDDLALYAMNVHYSGLVENVKATVAAFSVVRTTVSLVVIIAACSIVMFAWPYVAPQHNRGERAVCFAAALCPLLMFLLGIDYLRWSSMIVTNLLVATLTMVGLEEKETTAADGSQPQASNRFPAPWRLLFPGLCYIFLAFPQATGVANYRIPDEFRCEHLNYWSPLLRNRVLGDVGCESHWSYLNRTVP